MKPERREDILVSAHGDLWVVEFVTPRGRAIALQVGGGKWKNGAMVLSGDGVEKVVREALAGGLKVSF